MVLKVLSGPIAVAVPEQIFRCHFWPTNSETVGVASRICVLTRPPDNPDEWLDFRATAGNTLPKEVSLCEQRHRAAKQRYTSLPYL